MNQLAETGRLQFGVEFDCQLHADFVLRLPTVADNIAVYAEQPDLSGLGVQTAILQRCLVKLGDIPAETLAEPGWLAHNLVEDDYDELTSAMARLKKKRKAANSNNESPDSE